MKDDDAPLEDYVLELVSHWMPVVDTIWLCMIVGAILSAAMPQLACVSIHGKRHAAEDARSPSASSISSSSSSLQPSLLGLFEGLAVPKRLFTHFYVAGSALSFCLLVWMQMRPYHLKMLSATLFFIHCLRRLLECWYITEFGSSTMHLAGYLVGIIHYILTPLSLLIACGEESISFTSHALILGLRRRDLVRSLVSVALFLASSVLQFLSHRTLFLLKRKACKQEAVSHGPVQYPLPSGGGFDFCSCPHYLAEIGIYCSLTISSYHCKTMYYLLAWVIVNLSIVAYKQFSWYLERYPDEVLERKWNVLYPWLW